MKIANLIAAGILFSATAHAGVVNGPQFHVDRVNAYATDTYKLFFEGEETAIIRISGDGSTDLDCFAYDQNDHLVDSDTDASDQCVLRWTPAWTGKFFLKIRNLGRVSNRYSVSTN